MPPPVSVTLALLTCPAPAVLPLPRVGLWVRSDLCSRFACWGLIAVVSCSGVTCGHCPALNSGVRARKPRGCVHGVQRWMLLWCRLVAEGMGIIWGNSCCQGRMSCQQLAHLLPRWVVVGNPPAGPCGWGVGKRMGPNIDPQTRSCREESSLLSGRRCRASFGGGGGQGSLQVCFRVGRAELVAAPEGFAHVQPPPPPILANGCSPVQNSPRVLPAFGCVLWPTWRVPSSHLSQPCRLTGVWPQRGTGCVQWGYGRAELSCWGRELGALEDGPGGPWGS